MARTVFSCQIHPKNDERDLFEFFSEAGRVVDIQLLRDTRTFRSKGMCYIEFKDQKAVPHALSYSGRELGGYPIVVQLTQAEKNIAAQAAEAIKNSQNPLRLRITNLPRKVSRSDIEPIFSAFGEILHIRLRRADDGDSQTGVVEFKRETEAVAAMGQLNGLEILGHKLKCELDDPDRDPNAILDAIAKIEHMGQEVKSLLPGSLGPMPSDLESISSTGDTWTQMTAGRRAALMSKLSRSTEVDQMLQTASGVKQEASKPVAPAAVTTSSCLLLKNMFNPATEDTPDFDLDIREDVMEEVQKYGQLRHIYVDKTSPEGLVYLRFANNEGAVKTYNALHGRWFAQNQIQATYQPLKDYTSMFPDD